GIEPQIRQTMDNLEHTLNCAGTGMAGLTQALIYVTDREHLAVVNQVYAEYVAEPYPNRAAIIVSGFARPEMLVEIVAYAAVN
ncbi:MAG: RidA family protein, partial [Marinobacter sp.]|uniref:RidA family protein n=1 Tax=Marinobacter sp. TaxID=50741 RepID=UPI003974E4F5